MNRLMNRFLFLSTALCITCTIPAAMHEIDYSTDKDIVMVIRIGAPALNQTIILQEGDMLDLPVQAIVNAANNELGGGGGVTGGIWNALGVGWQEHVNMHTTKLGDSIPMIGIDGATPVLAYGEAAITPLLEKLPVGKRFIVNKSDLLVKRTNGFKNNSIIAVIHTPGPLENTPKREQLIRNSYKNSLQIAQNNKLTSIAFPLISAGIFGYKSVDSVKEVIPEIIVFYKTPQPKGPLFLKTIYLMFFPDSIGIAALDQYRTLFREIAKEDPQVHIVYDPETTITEIKKNLTKISHDLNTLAKRIS